MNVQRHSTKRATRIMFRLVCNLLFCLPSDITNNAVMLTSITAPDLTDVIIDLKFNTTAPTLVVGNAVTLIDGKLVATVTGTPGTKETAGGGGCNSGVGMVWVLVLGLLAAYGGVKNEKARRRF